MERCETKQAVQCHRRVSRSNQNVSLLNHVFIFVDEYFSCGHIPDQILR